MKLPALPFLKKKEAKKYYLVLLLRDDKATAVIFEELLGNVHVVGKHAEHFKASIEDASIEELLEILDKTISVAESSLPVAIETHQSVFGVRTDWVEDNKIKKEYLHILKRVCEELVLTPIGFLVIAEAIAHFLHKQEGAPVSALLVEIGKSLISISLIRAGKIVETKRAHVEATIPHAVDNLLKHFDSGILPARIILFDGEESDSLVQTFISHQWSKSLPFLHLPQITALEAGADAKAVFFGVASEMGFSLPPSEILIHTVTHREETAKEQNFSEEDRGERGSSDEIFLSANDVGFVADQDIKNLGDEQATGEKETIQEDEVSITADDSHEKKQWHHEGASDSLTHDKHVHTQSVPSEDLSQRLSYSHEGVQSRLRTRASPLSSLFSRIAAVLPFSDAQKNHNTHNRSPGDRKRQFYLPLLRNKKLFVIPFFIVLMLGGGYYAYSTLLRATITLGIEPKIIEEKKPLSFSARDESDIAQRIIKASLITVSIEGVQSIGATGKKDVGNKAKGTVTIYNNSNEDHTLAEGRLITTSSGLKFALDKEVKVASASGDIFSGTKPGKAGVAVTAAEIGSEYNMPSETKFSVVGSATIAAKNDSAFSGGSKKQVTVVSKDDIAKLTTDFPKSLADKVGRQAEKKIDDESILLPVFLSTTFAKKTFDKDVNEEAKSVTLRATVTFETLAYHKDDLSEFSRAFIQQSASADMTLADNGIEYEIVDVKKKDDKTLTALVVIKGRMIPKLNTKQLASELRGKTFDQAQTRLLRLPQVGRVTISLSPNLPFLPKILPQSAKNILIDDNHE